MIEGKYTILLCDDHTVIRQGLARILDDDPELKVIGEAENGRDAVKKTEELTPDVVLMDITMPLLNGIEATRQIRKLCPETKIIILSMHSHDYYISELFSLGVSGYLLKKSSGEDIIKAVKAVVQGDIFLSPSISKKVVRDYLTQRQDKSLQETLFSKLSNREREVFQLIAEGYSTKEISQMLFISSSTVKTHRTKIMEKMQMNSLSQLIKFAIELGLVEVRP